MTVVLFSTTLGSVYRETTSEENGTYLIMMGNKPLYMVSEAGGELKMEDLTKPRIFSMIVHDRTGAK